MSTVEVIVDSTEVIEVIEAGPKGDKGDAGLSLPDAPVDGMIYARKDGQWKDVSNVGLKSGYIGGNLPVITRVSPTSISIAGGASYVYRNLSGIPPVEWEYKMLNEVVEYTIITPIVNVVAYVYIDLRTMTVYDSVLSPAAKPHYAAYLGNVDFAAGDITVNRYIETAYSSPDTLTNLIFARGDFNLSGCNYFGNGGLTLGHTQGKGLRMGVNTVNNLESPDIIDSLANSIQYIVRAYKNASGNFVVTTNPTNVDPNQYAKDGVLTPVNNTKWTVQYIYHFYGSDVVVVYYGTAIFNSLELAESSIINPPTGIHQITKEASLRAALIVKGSSTNLADLAQAKFLNF